MSCWFRITIFPRLKFNVLLFPCLIMINVNDPELFTEPYLRGIRNTIRQNFDRFEGAPIFLKLRRKR